MALETIQGYKAPVLASPAATPPLSPPDTVASMPHAPLPLDSIPPPSPSVPYLVSREDFPPLPPPTSPHPHIPSPHSPVSSPSFSDPSL